MSGWNWNVWDVFFYVVPVACVVLYPLGGVDYLCGRLIPLFYSLVRFPLYLLIMCCLGECFFVNIARFVINSRKYAGKKQVLVIGQMLAPVVLLSVSFAVSLPPADQGLDSFGYSSYLHGFADRIKSRTDVEAIRAWLRTISDKDYAGKNPDAMTFDELPECLQVLRPKVITTWKDENNNGTVRLFWGSSLAGTWGVVIGMEDMKIPPSDFSVGGEYRLPLEPGVYVWYGLGDH